VSDRKYRQRGYQDDSRDREPRRDKPAAAPPAPRAPGRQLQDERGPKTPNLMASHEVFRCSRCGNRLSTPVELDARCSKCGVDLHACIQCAWFDTSARFECSQTALTARVSPKDARNHCTLFAPRTTVERQTSSPTSTSGGSSTAGGARQAFDDLFK
jgi:hypothetical protein